MRESDVRPRGVEPGTSSTWRGKHTCPYTIDCAYYTAKHHQVRTNLLQLLWYAKSLNSIFRMRSSLFQIAKCKRIYWFLCGCRGPLNLMDRQTDEFSSLFYFTLGPCTWFKNGVKNDMWCQLEKNDMVSNVTKPLKYPHCNYKSLGQYVGVSCRAKLKKHTLALTRIEGVTIPNGRLCDLKHRRGTWWSIYRHLYGSRCDSLRGITWGAVLRKCKRRVSYNALDRVKTTHVWAI